MKKMIGKLVQNGLFYNISGRDRTDFVKTNLYYQLLPNDVIEYEILSDNKCNVIKIINREPQITIAIIKGIVNKKLYISIPILSIIYNNYITCNSSDINIGDRFIVKITIDDIIILKKFKHISDRSDDINIIQDLMKLMIDEYTKIPLVKEFIGIETTNSYYTIKEIVDLTHLNTFTIDPENCRDADDAISFEEDKSKIYIHIVDICHYLKLNTDVYKKALAGAFTLYTPEGNFNIFDNDDSENRFSLVKDEKRNAITIELNLDSDYNVQSYDIYKSVVIVKNTFNYNNYIISNDIIKGFLTKHKVKNNINLPNKKLVIDKITGNLLHIEIYYNNENNYLVESIMVLANTILTKHLIKLIPQRYHLQPINNIKKDEPENIINDILKLKKYKTAKYSQQISGHYGLQLDNYTHFTSPIRRFFDCMIHAILGGCTYNNIEDIMEFINKRQRENETIVELYEKWKLYTFLSSNSDQIYKAVIIKSSKNGITYFIEELMFEGYIHISQIHVNEIWKFDSTKNQLVGEKFGKIINEKDIINIKFSKWNFIENDKLFEKSLQKQYFFVKLSF